MNTPFPIAFFWEADQYFPLGKGAILFNSPLEKGARGLYLTWERVETPVQTTPLIPLY
jgi:hypothetical protein